MEKTNLILLLTPKVIKDGRELEDITNQQRQRFKDAALKKDSTNIPEMIGDKPAGVPAEVKPLIKSQVKQP